MGSVPALPLPAGHPGWRHGVWVQGLTPQGCGWRAASPASYPPGAPAGCAGLARREEYKNLVGGSHHLELPALAVFLNFPPPIIGS